MALTREQTVALARSQIGVKEFPAGSNRVLYSLWYGLVGPWCAMFQSWLYWKAGIGWYRYASTAASVAAARRAGRLVPVAQALPGDNMVHLYSSKLGHTGMATVSGGRSTVEGNTNGGGSRSGGEVMEHDRPDDYWHYCIRMDFPSSPTPQPLPPPQPGVTVFNPPLTLPPIVSSAKDPVTGGSWLLGRDGGVFAFDGARFLGSAAGKPYFAGRTAAQLEVTADGRYVVVASSGERYGPGF